MVGSQCVRGIVADVCATGGEPCGFRCRGTGQLPRRAPGCHNLVSGKTPRDFHRHLSGGQLDRCRDRRAGDRLPRCQLGMARRFRPAGNARFCLGAGVVVGLSYALTGIRARVRPRRVGIRTLADADAEPKRLGHHSGTPDQRSGLVLLHVLDAGLPAGESPSGTVQMGVIGWLPFLWGPGRRFERIRFRSPGAARLAAVEGARPHSGLDRFRRAVRRHHTLRAGHCRGDGRFLHRRDGVPDLVVQPHDSGGGHLPAHECGERARSLGILRRPGRAAEQQGDRDGGRCGRVRAGAGCARIPATWRQRR